MVKWTRIERISYEKGTCKTGQEAVSIWNKHVEMILNGGQEMDDENERGKERQAVKGTE